MTTLEPPISAPVEPVEPLEPAMPRAVWTPVGVADAIADAFDRVTGSIERRVAGAAWDLIHVLGAHRWREGFEVNLEAGWRQYRGARCTICDVPWEGW
jgi:hypothetical protein